MSRYQNISKVLLEQENVRKQHMFSSMGPENLTVPQDAITDPLLTELIRSIWNEDGNNPPVFIERLTLACFRLGMLYERFRPKGPIPSPSKPPEQAEGEGKL